MYLQALLLGLFAAVLTAQPVLRLSGDVKPLKHTAALTLRPSTETFSGQMEIDVILQKPSALIWLNATDLSIASATVEAGATTQTADLESDSHDFLGLRLKTAIPAGAAKLKLNYTGKINAKDSAGIYLGSEANENYLFTQFAAIAARRAFPCFDQPDLKSSWQLTLTIPRQLVAASNTPQLSEKDAPDGMKSVVFAPTKLLSSYLIAFAVGPFDVVDGGKAGQNHIPIRFLTPKGKADQAKFAAEITPSLLERLERYFGSPYPFEKLDSITGPKFMFGGMENAGLIVYHQTLMLADPARDTLERRLYYALVGTHELAHQWFGNSVTMKWWDDIWLNEAFATWVASKILGELKPEWNPRGEDVRFMFEAISSDSLASTRRIRQSIESKDDIANAFDSITYFKGAAVIGMFEHWMGEANFRTGIISYLKRHASGNATSADFLDSVASTGQPRLTAAITTFLNQPGIPVISVNVNCQAAPRIVLSQKRLLPIGSTGSTSQTWQVPVCIRYRSSGSVVKECFLLDKPTAEYPLLKATACPDYVLGNDDAAGYYITAYSPDLLQKLLSGDISARLNTYDRLILMQDVNFLTLSGNLPVAQTLDVLKRMGRDVDWNVVSRVRSVVTQFRNIVPADRRLEYARLVTAILGERAAKLGWIPAAGERIDQMRARPLLVEFVAQFGADPALGVQATQLANEWLETRKGVDPSTLDGLLRTAAYFGGQPFFDRLLRELEKTTDPRERDVMVSALGASPDPKVAQSALQLLLNANLDGHQSIELLRAPTAFATTRHLPFEFVKANFESLVAKLPNTPPVDTRADLSTVGQGLCDADSRKEFIALFEKNASRFTGGNRNYQQALEGIQLCEKRKAVLGPAFDAFLAAQ